MRRASPHPAGRLAGLVALLGLGGCASLSADGGMSVVKDAARDGLGKDVVKIGGEVEAAAAETRIGELLRRPLSADGAVEVALLGNKGLQAAYNGLGISEAQFV